jgi:aerobic carbon-monoxide dehydrogenase medium subunit
VIPIGFDYHRASSIDDALASLSAGGKLLAGGHSLVPAMKLRLAEPVRLIDIGRIAELSGIRDAGGQIEIGAGTTHADVAASALLRDRCPMLAETAGQIGDPQVRNRGTLGGSLAHADPAADYPAAILALDADIHVRSAGGSRVVKAANWFQGLFAVDLRPDEMIVAIRFTPVRSAAYAKLHQRASHFAIVGVGAAVDVGGGTIRTARVAVTGAGTHAQRLTEVERALAGRPATAATADEAAKLATLEDVSSDIHASADYRRAMIKVFVRRAILSAIART